MNRRKFITLTAGVSICALAGSCPLRAAAQSSGQVIDAGPLDNYAKDGVYDAFRSLGFFIIRRSGELAVFSSLCTHRHVPLKAEPNGSFYCSRHGSTFDPNGHIAKGPASHDLPKLKTSISAAGNLLVYL